MYFRTGAEYATRIERAKFDFTREKATEQKCITKVYLIRRSFPVGEKYLGDVNQEEQSPSKHIHRVWCRSPSVNLPFFSRVRQHRKRMKGQHRLDGSVKGIKSRN